jgi:protein-disulfide isomerase-like protein with CxxC motif
MTERIQRAYYLEARNPSDDSTLIELAADIGLDCERFTDDLASAALHRQLLQEIQRSRMLGIDSFPSLAVEKSGQLHHIGLNYTDAQAMRAQIEASHRLELYRCAGDAGADRGALKRPIKSLPGSLPPRLRRRSC